MAKYHRNNKGMSLRAGGAQPGGTLTMSGTYKGTGEIPRGPSLNVKRHPFVRGTIFNRCSPIGSPLRNVAFLLEKQFKTVTDSTFVQVSRYRLMGEQHTARLFGWSLGGIFLLMLALNAMTR